VRGSTRTAAASACMMDKIQTEKEDTNVRHQRVQVVLNELRGAKDRCVFFFRSRDIPYLSFLSRFHIEMAIKRRI